MITSTPRRKLFDSLLREHLAWHKRARAGYRSAGLKRAELDEDALIILMIEVAEIVWRHDLVFDDVMSAIQNMISDIETGNSGVLQ